MNECNSIETIDNTNLTNQTKFRLDEIIKIENYSIEEINQRRWCSKELSKYVAVFDYIDQTLIVLRTTSGGISIVSFKSIIGAPVGIASCKSYFIFFSSNRNSKKNTGYNKKKKEKHYKILMLTQ